MNLQELKQKNSAELINEAEKLGIENPSTLRKQEILFAILKKLAEKNEQITATGVLEVLQDGFGFLRAIESNYLPGPDDIYVSPSQIRRFNQKNLELHSFQVKKIMTKNPIGINKDALAAKALSIMNNKKITSLYVYRDKNKKKAIGIIHIHNILQSKIS